MKQLWPRMDKSLKWDLEGTEEFEKRDLERTESSEMGPNKCHIPATLSNNAG